MQHKYISRAGAKARTCTYILACVVNCVFVCVARLRRNEKRQCFISILCDASCYTFQFSMDFYGRECGNVIKTLPWDKRQSSDDFVLSHFMRNFSVCARNSNWLSLNIVVMLNKLAHQQNKFTSDENVIKSISSFLCKCTQQSQSCNWTTPRNLKIKYIFLFDGRNCIFSTFSNKSECTQVQSSMSLVWSVDHSRRISAFYQWIFKQIFDKLSNRPTFNKHTHLMPNIQFNQHSFVL